MSDSTSISNSNNSEQTVKVANITFNATEDIIRKLFEFLGPITSLQLRDSPYKDGSREAIIEFQDHDTATTALHLSGTELGDRILVISFYSSTPTPFYKPNVSTTTTKDNENTIHVYHLSPTVTETDLSHLLSPCGPIIKMTLEKDGQDEWNSAMIEFETLQGAVAAVHFNGRLLKDQPISIYRHSNSQSSQDEKKNHPDEMDERQDMDDPVNVEEKVQEGEVVVENDWIDIVHHPEEVEVVNGTDIEEVVEEEVEAEIIVIVIDIIVLEEEEVEAENDMIDIVLHREEVEEVQAEINMLVEEEEVVVMNEEEDEIIIITIHHLKNHDVEI
ncbi:hypothetical protein INT45_005537, partial [Circinella minor]